MGLKSFRFSNLFLIVLRETNIIVTTITLISILYLRSIHSIWFGIGTLIATGTAKVLKRLIRQPRPLESSKLTYGMPSSHSSSISFFGIYLFLNYWLIGSLVRDQIESVGDVSDRLVGSSSKFQQGLDHHRIQSEAMMNYSIKNRLIGLSFIFGAGCVCWSRVRLGHHTPLQVIVGAMIGGSIGWIWFGIWSGFRIPKHLISRPDGIFYSSSSNNHHNHHHQTFSSSPSSSLNNGWVHFEGLGGSIESKFDQSVELLIEAWKMRDGGLVWDGLVRPFINFIGHRLLGFKEDLIPNGLPDEARIM